MEQFWKIWIASGESIAQWINPIFHNRTAKLLDANKRLKKRIKWMKQRRNGKENCVITNKNRND